MDETDVWVDAAAGTRKVGQGEGLPTTREVDREHDGGPREWFASVDGVLYVNRPRGWRGSRSLQRGL